MFLPPPKQFPEIIPSWSGTRMRRKFLRRMDKVFHGINFLGMIEEENLKYPNCYSTTSGLQEHYRTEYLLPPPEIRNILPVERLFGGTERDNPTDTTDLTTDFNIKKKTTELTTDLLLENKKCLVLEIVGQYDLEDRQLSGENLGLLMDEKTGEDLLMRTVPERNSIVNIENGN